MGRRFPTFGDMPLIDTLIAKDVLPDSVLRWGIRRLLRQRLRDERPDSAAARFSTNTICFNGRDLCAINPNYLNSVREDRPDATAGRDLVKVQFGADGRIDLTCYDDGCKGVGQ
mgnify:FL=1